MSDLPTPPASRLRTPSWLDSRLLVGIGLILISVVVGAKIVASSQHYDTVWAASRAIAPGTALTKTDLVRAEVRFKQHGSAYISGDGASPAGRTTVQPLAAGELIPLAAVPAAPPAAVRLVTVPVDKLHMPHDSDLHGVQVDMYVTPKSGAADAQPAPRLVLADVTIADTVTDSSLGGSGGSGVVLSVPLPYVDAVVAAAQQGAVDLVRVPDDATATTASPGPASSAPTASAPAGPASGAPS